MINRTREYVYHGDHMGPTSDIKGLIGTTVTDGDRQIGTVIGATTFTIIVKLSLLGYLYEFKKIHKYSFITITSALFVFISAILTALAAALVVVYLK